MKPGSVTSTWRAEQGGNELTVPNEAVVRHGVTIIGWHRPCIAPLAKQSSTLYATNPLRLTKSCARQGWRGRGEYARRCDLRPDRGQGTEKYLACPCPLPRRPPAPKPAAAVVEQKKAAMVMALPAPLPPAKTFGHYFLWDCRPGLLVHRRLRAGGFSWATSTVFVLACFIG